jgi:biotin carboxyl carrier protein
LNSNPPRRTLHLANARLQLENTKASSPWTQLENARINLHEAKQALENAQRAYDDAVSRPDEPNAASTVDRAYETLQRARNSVRTAQTSYYQAAQNFNNHQFDVAQRENGVVAAQLALGRAVEDAGLSTGSDNVRATQLRIDQIKGNIARSSLYAPFAGEVLEVTIKPGDRVEAFVAVITIGKPEPKEAVASLSFNDAQRLSVGLVGVCQIINQADTAVQCVVRRLPVSARDSDQTTRVAAILKTATSGQLVEIQMPLQVRSAVLWLPPVAVRTFQNRTFVVLQTPDGPRRADVEIGLRTDDRIEIKSGVREGDVAIGP